MAPMVDSGETTGGLEAEPGGAPVFTVAFSEPTSGLAVESRVEIRRTKLLGVPGCSMRDPSRRKSPKLSTVSARGWMVGMGLEGGDASPPKPITSVGGSFGAKQQGRMRTAFTIAPPQTSDFLERPFHGCLTQGRML